jgi:hypothetical protein
MPLVKYIPSDAVGMLCRVDVDVLRELYERTEETPDGEIVNTGVVTGSLQGHDGPVLSVFLTNGMFWHFDEGQVEINPDSTIEQSLGFLELLEIDATDQEVADKAMSALRTELLRRHDENHRLRKSA